MREEPLEVQVGGASLERTAALISGAVFERVGGSGHFPWLEQPGAVRCAPPSSGFSSDASLAAAA